MTYTLTNKRGQIIDMMTDAHGRNLLALWIRVNRGLGAVAKIGGAA
jgi:hypothetical protein